MRDPLRLNPFRRWQTSRHARKAVVTGVDEAASSRTNVVDHTAPDCLEQAIAAGTAAGAGSAQPGKSDIARAESILAAIAGPTEAMVAIARLLVLLERFPTSERLQILTARAVEKDRSSRSAMAVWSGIEQRFPNSHEALRMSLRWIARERGVSYAADLLKQRFPDLPVTYEGLLQYARAHEEVKLLDESDRGYEELIAQFPQREEPYVSYAASLRARGEIWRASDILMRAEAQHGATPALVRLHSSVNLDLHELKSLVPADGQSHAGNAVLGQLLGDLAQGRSWHAGLEGSYCGHVLMINGSLGSGGAERQFTNTAIALQTAMREARPAGDHDVVGPVTVCCRSLQSKKGSDFFLQDLSSHHIPVWEYSVFEPYGGRHKYSSVRDYRDLMRFLPHQMVEGTEKLTDVLRHFSPDVVHIWQDGSILATGLAALMAKVPRIVLAVRTLPPIDRPDRAKPQYETLYKEMLRIPGVVLTANSKFAAKRYAEWLDLDPARVPVIYNGLAPLPAGGDAAAQDSFASFAARTADADFTVGTVMRFDENKRPYLWLQTAATVLANAPGSRFILVGEGPLLVSAVEYAQRLGIGDRILFAGRSSDVGFWLSKLDAFLLLSRFEGLPNVLIEAQFAGVPVFTTAAGGAAETVQEGITGHVYADTENPDPADLAAWLLRLRSDPATRAAMSAGARQWVAGQFSIAKMLAATVNVYLG